MVVGVGGAVFWEWSPITEFYFFLNPDRIEDANSGQPQNGFNAILNRLHGSRSSRATRSAHGATLHGGQTAAVQRVLLYEETRPIRKGSATAAPRLADGNTFDRPGLSLLAVRADVTIPERRMAVIWALRRNAEKRPPVHHRDHVQLAGGFLSGGIANVSGILMKQAEQARGTGSPDSPLK